MNLEQIRPILRKACPIYEFIGLEVLDSEARVGRCRVELNRETSNHIGTIHAGVQWTIAEAVGGVIALRNFDTRRYVPVIRSVEIQFERRALGALTAEARLSEGEFERVEAELQDNGKADFELQISLATDAGPVTRARARYQLRDAKR
jgi:acyl-coenzyme A thioesterase PaaI-like protein